MAALINKQKIPSVHAHRTLRLGMPTSSKTDEFSEKFQTSFDPPPSFSEIILQFFPEIRDRSIVYNGKNPQYKFLD